MSDQKLIKVSIRSTEDLIYEGNVDRITSHNEVGQFDIYPMHANFISIIEKEVILYNNHLIVKNLKLDRAVMKVKQDIVSIYLGIEALLITEEAIIAEQEKNAQKAAAK